jgi:NADH-quinone oxidoreductase subunit L
VFAGLLSLGAEGAIEAFLEPIAGAVPRGVAGVSTTVFYAVALTITAVGLIAAWWIYGSGRVDWQAMRERLQPLPRTLEAGWYVDSLYSNAIVEPGKIAARAIGIWFDQKVIDGFVNAIGAGAKRVARGGRLVQTGYVRTYALVVFLGAVIVLAYVGVRA